MKILFLFTGFMALLYILYIELKKERHGILHMLVIMLCDQYKDWLVIQSLCWTNIKPFTLTVTPLTAGDNLC